MNHQLNHATAVSTSGVAVIICAYTLDRWDDLVAAVGSVGMQTTPAHETIVVIDGNDELYVRATAEFASVTVLMNAHSPGLSGGRRTGAEHAVAPVLAFLDDDAVAEPDWLEHLVGAYSDPGVLGVGGLVVPNWELPPPDWFPAEFNWVVGCTYAGMPVHSRRIRNPIGANMSVRADVFARAGAFDARLGRHDRGEGVAGAAEETEFGIRAVATHPGRYWVYEPLASVHHAVPRQRATWRYFVRRCWVEGHAKALLAGLTGADDGLRSERTYTRSVLPRAVARELRRGMRGESGATRRAGAIVCGLGITVAAYGRTRLLVRLRGATA